MKKCPQGEYYCNDSKKCKPIPKGWHTTRLGWLVRDNEKKISARTIECIEAAGGGRSTGKLVGGSVGAAVGSGLSSVPFVGWVLTGAATMMGMEQGGNIGADMAQMGKDCDPEILEDK